MDHLEGIVELKNIVNPDFCKKVIALTNKKATEKLTVGDGLRTDIRNVIGYGLNFKTPTNLFYWNR